MPAWKWEVKVFVAQSCLLFETPWNVACQAPLSMEFSRQEYWSELPFPSPGIKQVSPPRDQTGIPTQGSNPGLLHCRQILYRLSHQRSSFLYESITETLWGIQFSSVAQSCLNLCNPMDSSTPGFPVHHQLPELAQTHVQRVSDAIQLSHSLLSPSPPTFSLSQHQGLFQWVSSSYQVAKCISPILTKGNSSKKWRTFFHLFKVTSCQGWNWDSSPNSMYFPAIYSVLKLGSLLSFFTASPQSNCLKLVFVQLSSL